MLLVTACGPVYKTSYSFAPPPTAEGRQCAQSCLQTHNECKAQCEVKKTQCREIESLKAENAYLKYVAEQKDKGKEVERTQSSFADYGQCDTGCEENCAFSHRVCHVNCGGNVTERRYCTAFCD